MIHSTFILYTHGVTCKLSKSNSACNDIYKKDKKTKCFLKKTFFNKFYVIFHFLMCIYINTEYWPNHSFNFLFLNKITILLS